MNNYYDQNYFNWQKKIGQDGVLGDSWMFSGYINENDSVLDFGCGGGYILASLECKEKFGVEINDVAAEQARQNGIETYKNINDISNDKLFDKIISHHALEHVENPFGVLMELKNKLKENGKIIFVTPIDDWRKQKEYIKEDINKHLYTWTPLNLGNLFWAAGFKVENVKVVPHSLISLAKILYKFLPSKLFWLSCRIKGNILKYRHVILVATK